MQLIIFHENRGTSCCSDSLLRFALGDQVMSAVILDGLGKSFSMSSRIFPNHNVNSLNSGQVFFALPEVWKNELACLKSGKWSLEHIGYDFTDNIISYAHNVPVEPDLLPHTQKKKNMPGWLIVSSGRYATHTNPELLKKILQEIDADIVAVNVRTNLMSKAERVRLTSSGKIAGFRRLYNDSAELASIPDDWPCHLFMKENILAELLDNRNLPDSFNTLIERCYSKALTVQGINIGGAVFDMDTAGGLLDFCRSRLDKMNKAVFSFPGTAAINKDAKFIGRVLLGDNVHIEQQVVIAGPAIIGNNVDIRRGAVINASLIGANVCVCEKEYVNKCIRKETRPEGSYSVCGDTDISISSSSGSKTNMLSEEESSVFRCWSRFTYPGLVKRIADFIAAAIVVILFAPLAPVIALAIKFTSSGPVFYGDLRQGLHGKKFHCMKFRTMITGANKIQEKLRFVSNVDGPQFKIVDDPRISRIGKFLRDTYIDEIPQFLNVLAGQMSIVGPRPSPESENTMCPFWRDARLSVRPGITGLWQISRTRQPMKDFQEWIRYDTEYVRNLSLKMDLWICWCTFKKLVNQFINQF